MKKPVIWISVSVVVIAILALLFTMNNGSGFKQSVTFKLHAPDAKTVFVTGSFNAWNSVEYLLEKKNQGMWETTILLAPGRYEYKFIVDTIWIHDVNNPVKVPAPLPFVGYNSVIDVKKFYDAEE